MKRRFVILAVFISVLGPGAIGLAHEIKVLGSRLVTQPGSRDTVYLSWGHILPIDIPIEPDAVRDYELRTPSGSIQYLRKDDGPSLHANEIRVEEEGVYTAVVTREPSVYTVVVDEQGQHSHRSGPKSGVPSSEGEIDYSARSHQFAKALMVSGHAHEEAIEPLGHPFEIVPLEGPEAWRAGADLHFRVLYQGRPATRQDVFARFIGFKPDEAWCYAIATDSEGIATIHVDRPGTWIVRARRQDPAAEADRAEFDVESFSATLAFEVLP